MTAIGWCAFAAGSAVAGTDEQDTPVIDGTTITATYLYGHMPFFEAGYKLAPKVKANIASVDCGEGGKENPAGGPGGAFECGYHPAVTSASITITGKKPWSDLSSTIVMTPYTSFDDQTYETGKPIPVMTDEGKAATTPKEKAGQAYLAIGAKVNTELTTATEKIGTWDAKTTGKQAAADIKNLDKALDQAKDDLKKLQKDYPAAKKAIKAQIKAINAVQADLTAAGGINEGVDLVKWKEQLDQHLKDLSGASTAVRDKLGLPEQNQQPPPPAE